MSLQSVTSFFLPSAVTFPSSLGFLALSCSLHHRRRFLPFHSGSSCFIMPGNCRLLWCTQLRYLYDPFFMSNIKSKSTDRSRQLIGFAAIMLNYGKILVNPSWDNTPAARVTLNWHHDFVLIINGHMNILFPLTGAFMSPPKSDHFLSSLTGSC